MSRSLIVLPDDSAKPILEAIHGAEKSVRVKMFVFSDPALLKAVIAAKHRVVCEPSGQALVAQIQSAAEGGQRNDQGCG